MSICITDLPQSIFGGMNVGELTILSPKSTAAIKKGLAKATAPTTISGEGVIGATRATI